MNNPFNYLQLATGDQFYDRTEIRNDLLSRFLSGPTNVVLYGPRRYGKSSLVAELVSDLERNGIPCVTIDIVKVPTVDLFLQAYVTKIYRKLTPVRFEFRKIGQFLKSLRPKLTLGSDGETGITFDAIGDEIDSNALTEVLDLPQRLLGPKQRAVIVFDEFQEVSDLLPDDRFERVMRSVIQNHRNVSYIFLGSRYHMLRRMFTDHNRPFYKSALTMLLDKPPVEDSIRFIADRFNSRKKSIDQEAAELMLAKIDNIPYYVQQLGFEVFRIIDDANRKNATVEDVNTAYAHLSGFNRDQYEQLMLTFSAVQKKLLIALAREPAGTFDDNYRRNHLLGASSTVNSAKTKLMEDGHIELSNRRYTIADPFFGEFLREV